MLTEPCPMCMDGRDEGKQCEVCNGSGYVLPELICHCGRSAGRNFETISFCGREACFKALTKVG